MNNLNTPYRCSLLSLYWPLFFVGKKGFFYFIFNRPKQAKKWIFFLLSFLPPHPPTPLRDRQGSPTLPACVDMERKSGELNSV